MDLYLHEAVARSHLAELQRYADAHRRGASRRRDPMVARLTRKRARMVETDYGCTVAARMSNVTSGARAAS